MRLGDFSRLTNRLFGGRVGETICARLVRTRGHDCWQCRLIGVFLGRDHCWEQFIHELKERRK